LLPANRSAIFEERHVPVFKKGGDPMSSRLLTNAAIVETMMSGDASGLGLTTKSAAGSLASGASSGARKLS
jgi:hypothetical protein